MRNRLLLISGPLSSIIYLGMLAIIPVFYEGYSSGAYTVSELSAIGAPTRAMWLICVIVYSILLGMFGWGVRQSGERTLRIAGTLVIVHSVFGLFWPPMHTREVIAAGGATLTDTLHIAWTAITVPLMIMEIIFGAASFPKAFKWYSAVTIVTMMVTGVMTGLSSPAMEAGKATPWMGTWERIGIIAFMFWIIVFAVMIVRKNDRQTGFNIEQRIAV